MLEQHTTKVCHIFFLPNLQSRGAADESIIIKTTQTLRLQEVKQQDLLATVVKSKVTDQNQRRALRSHKMAHPHQSHEGLPNAQVIPLLSKTGTVLSEAEREEIARKRGLCVRCGIKTHEVKGFFKRTPLHTDHVYHGICIGCHPDQVPPEVSHEWKRKMRSNKGPHPPHSPTGKFRAAVRATTAFHINDGAGSSAANLRPSLLDENTSRTGPVRVGSNLSSTSIHSSGRSQCPSTSDRELPIMERSRQLFNFQSSSMSLSTSEHSRQLLNRQTSSLSTIPDEGPQHQSLNSFHSEEPLSMNERALRHGNVLSSRSGGGPPSPSERRTPSWQSYDHEANLSIRSAVVTEDFTGGDSTDDKSQVIKAIKENRRNPHVLKQKLHRLRNLADGDGDVIPEICNILNEYRNDSTVLTVATGALWSVSANDDNKKIEAAECGAIDCILDSLRNSRTQQDATFDEWAIGTLACLARGKHNRESIGNLNGVETILDTLRLHQGSAGVFEWSCRALHALVHQYQDEDDNAEAIHRNIMTISESEGVSVIVCAMKKHHSDTVAQGWAISLLLRLLHRQDLATANQVLSQINEEDGITALVYVFEARSTSPEVLTLAAELLANLVVEAEAAKNTTALYSAVGCITAVVRMMKDYGRDENLQTSLCRLLSKLAISESGRHQIKESKALECILYAMTLYTSNLPLQEAGSWILWSMSSFPSLFNFSYVNEALKALEMSTKEFSDASLLLAGACGFIANIATTNEANLPDIPIKIPMRALKVRDPVDMLEEQACRGLINIFSRTPKNAGKLFEGGGVEAVVMRMESASLKASAAACKVLAAVAEINDENKQSLIEAGCVDGVVALLRTSSSVSGLDAAFDLIIVVLGWKQEKSVKLPNDSVSVILNKIQSQGDNIGLIVKACGTLVNLLLSTATGSTTLELGGLVESMTNLLNSHANPVEVKEAACAVLWALVTKQRTRDTSNLSSMFGSVVSVMRAYTGEDQPFNSDLQLAAAGALGCITACFQETPVPINSEAVDCVIAVMYMAMEHERDRTELLEKLMTVLLNLTLVNDSLVIQCGGIIVVIDAMTEHEQKQVVQELGCSILALLASAENLEVNMCITETDGIGVIINGLATFSSNERLQVAACKALSHLSIDQESRMLITFHGGLTLLVNAMNTNVENIDILEGACVALLNLSAHADEPELKDAKVIETVINMMRNNPDISKLQEKGLGVLQNLSMRISAAKSEIARLGGIRIIVEAINAFMAFPEVLARAFTTMWSLALLDSNQKAIADAGGVELVLNGMLAQLNSAEVQKQACGCLCTLSSNSRNNSLIRDADGVDAIVYAMWAHYDSAAVLSEACRALSSVAVNLHTNEVIIAQDGEINAIIAAMRRFPNLAKLQENACVALRNLLLSPESFDSVRYLTDDIRVVVSAAAALFPDECADCSAQVLAQLS